MGGRRLAWLGSGGGCRRLLWLAAVLLGVVALGSSSAASPGPKIKVHVPSSPSEPVRVKADVGAVSVDANLKLSSLLPLGTVTGLVDPLRYEIRTLYDGGGGCGNERIKSAYIGVPKSIDAGGSFLTDVVVHLTVVPGVGGSPDVLSLNVTRATLGNLKALVEVLVPVPGTDQRVAFGYDGCETGVPVNFSATIVADATGIRLRSATTTVSPALTVLGSIYRAVGTGRIDPTALSARLAPMPFTTSVDVDILGEGAYRANLSTERPTHLTLNYLNVVNGTSTTAQATINTFPGRLNVGFSPTKMDYTAATPLGGLRAPITAVDLAVESRGTQQVQKPTTNLEVALRGVPDRATLQRTSDTAVVFDAPNGAIQSATVSFSSVDFGVVNVPTVAPLADQYLVADIGKGYARAKVRVIGLTHATVDAGDPNGTAINPDTGQTEPGIPMVVKVVHSAGPFHVKALATQSFTAQDPNGGGPIRVTRSRRVDGHVLQLPATADVRFNAKTQAFSYTGLDRIGELIVEVTDSRAFVDDATRARLRILDFPTGLTGRLNEAEKTFEANLTGGALGVLEVLVTSETEEDLLPGTDGVWLTDEEDKYTAFVRISGLEAAKVGWGGTLLADLTHRSGPFLLHAHVNDPNANEGSDPGVEPADLLIEARLVLPARARFEYTPGVPNYGQCGQPVCGEGATRVAFTGDAPVPRLDLDVVANWTIAPSSNGNIGGNEAHFVAANIPAGSFPDPDAEPGSPSPTPSLLLIIDGTGHKMSAEVAGDGTNFMVTAQLCSTDLDCRPQPQNGGGVLPPLPQDDGLFLTDLDQRYNLFGRLSGLAKLELEWGDVVRVHAHHAPGPFDIVVEEDKEVDAFGEKRSYGATTTVAIRSLPATVNLLYERSKQSISYQGSAGIGSIEAWRSVEPVIFGAPKYAVVNAIAGRATEAHLLVKGLPAQLNLVVDFGPTGDRASICTAAVNELGKCVPFDGETELPILERVELELLSTNDLRPVLNQRPVVSDGYDGLVAWNLDDFDFDGDDKLIPPIEPFEDPFAIVVRATNLQSFTYAKSDLVDDFEHHMASAELVRAGGPNLWIEVRRAKFLRGQSIFPIPRVPENVPGLQREYRHEYMTVDYDQPPDRLAFELDNKERNTHNVLEFAYSGSGPGAWVQFKTNFGNMDFLDMTLSPVPAGEPGITGCIGANNMRCSPKNRESAVGQLSISLDVASFTTLEGTYQQRDDKRVHFNTMHIESGITASKERNPRTAQRDDAFVYVDTHGGTVDGTLRVVHRNLSGKLDTEFLAELPPEFRAIQRYVEIEIVNTAGREGSMICPAGTVMEMEAIGIDLSISDDLCSSPRLDAVYRDTVAPAQLTPGTYTLDLIGANFVPSWTDRDGIIHKGTDVSFGSDTATGFVRDPGISVDRVDWISVNELTATVTVSGADPSSTAVRVKNPIATSGNPYVCGHCFQVASG